MRAWIGILALACAFSAQAAPKVAVMDLAYQERVQEYIHVVSAQQNYREGYYSSSGSASYNELEASTSYIEEGELRKFTGDIKGGILKSGMFQLVQGSPHTDASKTNAYDIIKRIDPAAEPNVLQNRRETLDELFTGEVGVGATFWFSFGKPGAGA